MLRSICGSLALAMVIFVPCVSAQDTPTPVEKPSQAESPDAKAPEDRRPGEQADPNADSQDAGSKNSRNDDKEAKLAAYLSGAKFVGQFTVDGRNEKPPKTEEYTISGCEKLPAPDMYRFTARIKYGDVDQEVPLDLKILWAGRTPVITMDQFWIPGMGTFGARVLIHSDRYSGTWQHDAVGGHLFGKIVK